MAGMKIRSTSYGLTFAFEVSMTENKNIVLSYASALQEAGVLLSVFGPMYLTFDSEISGWWLTLGMLFWIALGFVSFRLGIEIQRRSP
jgi:hypothetical protein